MGVPSGRAIGPASLGSILGALCTGFVLIAHLSLKVVLPATAFMMSIFSLLSLLVSGKRPEGVSLVFPMAFLAAALPLGKGGLLEKHLLCCS